MQNNHTLDSYTDPIMIERRKQLEKQRKYIKKQLVALQDKTDKDSLILIKNYKTVLSKL